MVGGWLGGDWQVAKKQFLLSDGSIIHISECLNVTVWAWQMVINIRKKLIKRSESLAQVFDPGSFLSVITDAVITLDVCDWLN